MLFVDVPSVCPVRTHSRFLLLFPNLLSASFPKWLRKQKGRSAEGPESKDPKPPGQVWVPGRRVTLTIKTQREIRQVSETCFLSQRSANFVCEVADRKYLVLDWPCHNDPAVAPGAAIRSMYTSGRGHLATRICICTTTAAGPEQKEGP